MKRDRKYDWPFPFSGYNTLECERELDRLQEKVLLNAIEIWGNDSQAADAVRFQILMLRKALDFA